MRYPIVVISMFSNNLWTQEIPKSINQTVFLQLAAVGNFTDCVHWKQSKCSKIRGLIDAHTKLIKTFDFEGPYLVVEDDAQPCQNWTHLVPKVVEHDITNLACQSHFCKGTVALLFRNIRVHRALVALWNQKPYNDIDCHMLKIGRQHCGPTLFGHKHKCVR